MYYDRYHWVISLQVSCFIGQIFTRYSREIKSDRQFKKRDLLKICTGGILQNWPLITILSINESAKMSNRFKIYLWKKEGKSLNPHVSLLKVDQCEERMNQGRNNRSSVFLFPLITRV